LRRYYNRLTIAAVAATAAADERILHVLRLFRLTIAAVAATAATVCRRVIVE